MSHGLGTKKTTKKLYGLILEHSTTLDLCSILAGHAGVLTVLHEVTIKNRFLDSNNYNNIRLLLLCRSAYYYVLSCRKIFCIAVVVLLMLVSLLVFYLRCGHVLYINFS